MRVPLRVAAVHDLSGVGRCSLGAALPILTAMGAECHPLLTAYLSAHTAYAGFTFEDMTHTLNAVIDHWSALGLRFRALYSGFFGSAGQIDIVRRAIDVLRPEIVLADPVMGDHGKVYSTYTPEMCARVASLTEFATLITPNVTEAAILLGKAPDQAPRSLAEAKNWLRALSGGKRGVVLTGLRLFPENITTLCLEANGGKVYSFAQPYVGRDFCGTGDVFASVTLGSLLRGGALPRAVSFAAKFVRRAAALTGEDETDLDFAPLMRLLTARGKTCISNPRQTEII